MKRTRTFLRQTIRLALAAMLALTACIVPSHAQSRRVLNFNLDWQLHVGDLPATLFSHPDSVPSDIESRTVSLPRAFNGEEAFARSIYELTDTVAW